MSAKLWLLTAPEGSRKGIFNNFGSADRLKMSNFASCQKSRASAWNASPYWKRRDIPVKRLLTIPDF